MSLATILEEVRSVVLQVTGVGPVLVHFRHTNLEKEFLDTYSENKVLKPWIVTAREIEAIDIGPQFHRDRYKIVIHGYRAVASGVDSEKTLQEESESVRAKLNDETNRLLNGNGRLVTPCKRRAWNEVLLNGSAHCWHVELEQFAEEKLSQ